MYDGGAIFDNPKRGSSVLPNAGRHEPDSVGKDGAEGQEGVRSYDLRCEVGPGRWSSKSPRAPRERNAAKVKEGSRNAMSDNILGRFPHGG